MPLYSPANTSPLGLVRPWGVFGFSEQFTKDDCGSALPDLRLSAGTDDSGTFRVRHTAMYAASGIRLVFMNAGNNGNGANDVVIAGCGVEVSGTTYRVTFSGANTITLKPGQIVRTDPVRTTLGAIVSVAAADTFYSRTHYTVTLGEKWQTNVFQNTGVARGEANNRGTTATDRSQDTGTTNLTTTAGEYVPSPIAVLCDQPSTTAPKARVLLLGDSITSGSGDVNGTTLDNGYAVRAVTTAALPHFRASLSGEQASQLNTATIRRALREPLYDGHTHAVVMYGTNDLNQSGRALATIQTDLIATWTRLNQRGIKVFACTVPPFTTSSDSWATTVNQTAATQATGGEATRGALNDWIRTKPSPLTGFFETADTVESARNSGKWKVTGAANAYTADGIHPSATGHAAMAAGIDTTLFT